MSLTARIEAILPQTQCRQCGYDGCARYAQAIASGEAPINRCAPGGQARIARLAMLLGTPEIPLDPEYGAELPFAVAKVDPQLCIGCMKCVQHCPVDAITGAPKHLCGIIASRCTGCGLCVAPCPMDCITMRETEKVWTDEDARQAKVHYEAHNRRLERAESAHVERLHALQASKSTVMAEVIARMLAAGVPK